MLTWNNFTKMIEAHPVVTGLIVAAIAAASAAAGWASKTVFQAIEIETAAASSKVWEAEFGKWKDKYQDWLDTVASGQQALAKSHRDHYIQEVGRSKDHNDDANTRSNEAEGNRASEFNAWIIQKESDYRTWLDARTKVIERDANRINASNEAAQKVATKAEVKANDVKVKCDAAESDLMKLLAFSEKLKKHQGDLPAKVRDLLLADPALLIEPLSNQMNSQAPPIGAVMAWPSPISEAHPCPAGWHLCDDTSLQSLGLTEKELTNLRAALPAGTYKGRLPDFRGYFLRGAGRSPGGPDPDLASRKGTGPGSTQGDGVGRHVHDGVISAPPAEKLLRSTAPSSEETHATAAFGNSQMQRTGNTIQGAEETRPVNIAVHWIIRIR